MSLPLLSIIIPTFNRAHLINETIESVIKLNYSNWECLIIDDGSTDTTQQLIEAYSENDSRIQYYKRPEHYIKGANSCRNFGFEKCKGAWVKWFDSDDLFSPEAYDFLTNKIDTSIDLILSKIEIIDLKTNIKIRENIIFSDNLIQDYLIGKVAFYISGPTWNRLFLDKQSELFDKSISNLDDWDFNLRMLYQKPSIVYQNNPTIKYRIHSDSLAHEIGKLNTIEIISEMYAREKHLKILARINHPAKKVFLKFIAIRYKYFFRETLISNNASKFYFLNKVFIYQFKTFDFLGIIKTIFGFLFFIVFKKGYKFLK
jgi:glycosyltransferase involved in cell wall biosynthesis